MMITFYSINPHSINYKTALNDPYNEIMLDMMDDEMELSDALEITVEAIEIGIIDGADIVDNQTGEILFIFDGETTPTYNTTDITF